MMSELQPPNMQHVGIATPELPAPPSRNDPMPRPRDPEHEPKPFHAASTTAAFLAAYA